MLENIDSTLYPYLHHAHVNGVGCTLAHTSGKLSCKRYDGRLIDVPLDSWLRLNANQLKQELHHVMIQAQEAVKNRAHAPNSPAPDNDSSVFDVDMSDAYKASVRRCQTRSLQSRESEAYAQYNQRSNKASGIL